jgi:hypothetical protein
MSESLLDKQIVLSLNANWQALGYRTVRQAIVALTGTDGSHPAALAVDITFDEEGKPVVSHAVKWDEWVKLPVDESQLSLGTKTGQIRCPLVIVNPVYGKMPLKTPRLSPTAIWERDGGLCQYSGKKLTKRQGNLDHVVPKSRGGKDSWENMVLCDKTINSGKGNRLNAEVGLKLLKRPKAPPSVPASFSVKEARHPAHAPFIHQ